MLVIPSVSLSVCPRHKSSKECSDRKNNEEQSCSKFSEDGTYSSDFFRASLTHARNAFFVFAPMMKFMKGVSDRKSEEEKSCLLSQEKPHSTTASLVQPPLTREARYSVFVTRETRFLCFRHCYEVLEGALIEKVRSNLVCYPEKMHILPRQGSCSPRSRTKRVFVFSPRWGSVMREICDAKCEKSVCCSAFKWFPFRNTFWSSRSPARE